MSDNVSDILLEHLRGIRGRLDTLTDEVGGMHREMRAMKQHMAAFHTDQVIQDGDIADLRRRVARLEARLELRDS